MSAKTVWVCDGCDEQKDVTANVGDWRSFAVSASGFRGYPTCAPNDPTEIKGHLCPSCASRYYEYLHPRQWARVTLDKTMTGPK